MSERFPLDMSDRGVVKITDNLLIHNIDTGVTEYTTVDKLLDVLGIKGQVKFPVVQIPSADVNTLDDYKEGTFVPTIKFAGASVGITYGADTGGRYTKIGNMILFSGTITLTSKGVSAGGVTICDLPYICKNDIASYSPVSLLPSTISFANQMIGYVIKGTSQIGLYEMTEAGVVTLLDDTNFSNTSYISFSGSYEIV
jgi:hypothetical protein